jgi:YfiH family protein
MIGPVLRDGAVVTHIANSVVAFSNASLAPRHASEEELAEAAATFFSHQFQVRPPVLYAMQEHGSLSFTYSSSGPLPPGPHFIGHCDALITAEAGVALCVRTADCLPIAFAGGDVVAMIHGGWRGLAADILGKTTRRIANEFGQDPANLVAVIGVGIGPCHYPVGDEVVNALSQHDVGAVDWRERVCVNLATWAYGRLAALGFLEENIAIVDGCTACLADYHSYRRDGSVAGRQWNAILRLS